MNFTTTTTTANNNNDDDEVQSDDFSDFDEPYHETASNWLRRSARRRARRLAGLSSCSSSSSSDESIDEEGSNNNTNNNNNNNVTILYKPIMKWQRQYPIAAARACLSLLQLDDVNCTINSHRSRSPRERECNRLHRVLRKIHRKQSMHLQQQHQQQQQQQQKGAIILGNVNEDNVSQAMKNDDKLVIESFLPNGTGISFIDSALSKDKNASGMRGKSCSLVMELTGGRRSGRTTTLLAIAARYVACTTSLFFPNILEYDPNRRPLQGESSHRPSKRQRRDGHNNSQTQSVVEPRIIVLDIDHCFNPIKLMLAVREAVLRRFHETSVARKWVKDLMIASDTRASTVEGTTMAEEEFGMQLDDDDGDNDVSAREKKMIDHAIASCLGRINIVQPKDFTYLALVATLESLRQSLDQESKHTNHAQAAPTMIMIDSMSTLDASTQYQESLPTKGSQSGLSDRNEFYRQLIRLRDSHQVAIIGTSLTTAGRCSIWDKMITNRVFMQKRIND